MRALIVLILIFPHSIFANEPFSHALFDKVLQQFVDDQGLVDYGALQFHTEDLNVYVARIGSISPENKPAEFPVRADRLAYWLNTYNALAMKSVVDTYPVKSVRDIKWFYGFFNRTKHLVGKKEYTLKYIEHEIIRKQFLDPRIHVGLNCASMGCPKLPQKAYRGETLDADLDVHMRFFLREKRNVRFDRANKRLYLSHILDEFETDFTFWFQKQFAKKNPTIIDYIKLYVSEADQQYLEQHPYIDIEYMKYDWRLNDQAMSR